MALKLSSHLPMSLDIKTHKKIQRHPHFLLLTSPKLSSFGCPFSPNGGRGARAGVSHAVSEEQTQYSAGTAAGVTQVLESSPSSSSKIVLVIGGTGGVGQLVVASLLSRNIKAHLLLRDPVKAMSLFGIQDEDRLKIWKGDTRNPRDIDPTMFEGVTHVICCTGTTAFPSKRWEGDNTPERVDWEGIRNLVSALPPTLKRFVLVSSVGVTKFGELPWRNNGFTVVVIEIFRASGVMGMPLASCSLVKKAAICAAAGMLAVCRRHFKKMGEDFVRNSGLPYTIIRAGRLTDGPYTSYDLNTLLKATAGERRAVVISQGDKLVGEVSRLVVAEACIQALDIDFTQGQIYEINSIKGEGPGKDPEKWKELFKAATVN